MTATRVSVILEVDSTVVEQQEGEYNHDEWEWVHSEAGLDDIPEYPFSLSTLFYGDGYYTGLRLNEVIRNISIQGSGVIYADMPSAGEVNNPCVIPHMGHNTSCNSECEQDNKVFRLFGVYLYLEGEIDRSILGRYQIMDGVEIDVCGVSRTQGPGTNEIEKL